MRLLWNNNIVDISFFFTLSHFIFFYTLTLQMHHPLKYVTPYMHTHQRLPTLNINHHTLKLKQPLHYRHVIPKDYSHLTHSALFSLAQNQRQSESNIQNLFQFVSQEGFDAVVGLLLADPRVDPSTQDNEAIRWASKKGHLDVVQLLLADPRVDPSVQDNYAIQWASECGHDAIVRLLLADPRVDPSARDNFAICVASGQGHDAVVQLLLGDPRVDPSARDNCAIHGASYRGHDAVVRLLLKDPRVDPSVISSSFRIKMAVSQWMRWLLGLVVK